MSGKVSGGLLNTGLLISDEELNLCVPGFAVVGCGRTSPRI
jgi:hypothetical protein